MALVQQAAETSGCGPTLTTWALQQVASFLGYTGRAANVTATAESDPNVWSGRASQEVSSICRFGLGAFRAPGHRGYQRACVLIS
jgi:hypothetical protein